MPPVKSSEFEMQCARDELKYCGAMVHPYLDEPSILTLDDIIRNQKTARCWMEGCQNDHDKNPCPESCQVRSFVETRPEEILDFLQNSGEILSNP